MKFLRSSLGAIHRWSAGLALAIAALGCSAGANGIEKSSVDREEFADLGQVSIWHPAGAATDLLFLLQGPGATPELPRRLAEQGHLVAQIPVQQFLDTSARNHADCITAVTLLDVFSQHLQEKYRFERYQKPVLIGTGAAAALAYGTLAQAPKGVFRAGIGVDFCPTLQLPAPFCRGENPLHWDKLANNSYRLQPSHTLVAPWYQLGSPFDNGFSTCAAESEPFRNRPAPSAGQGDVATQIDMLAASLQPVARAPNPLAVDDLPLVELPAKTVASDFFVVLLSGDGGWADIDQDMGNALSAQGIPVVGWNTLKYFWNKKTPDQASADLQRVIAHYQRAWKRPRVLLLGFSLGADVLPFMITRLPLEQRAQIADIALLSLSHTVDFQFHVTDWLVNSTEDNYPIAPELKKIARPILCVYGKDDNDTLCREAKAANIANLELPGDHHFNGDYAKVLSLLLEHARKQQL